MLYPEFCSPCTFAFLNVILFHTSHVQHKQTVNTAARMESNGLPGRIHMSEQTATKLKDAGKSDWVTQREDKIVAKGKGELISFWLCTEIDPVEKTVARLGTFLQSTSMETSSDSSDHEDKKQEADIVVETQVWI